MTVRIFSHGHRVGHEVYVNVLYGVLIMFDRWRRREAALYFNKALMRMICSNEKS
jgi:hypothetical protein